MKIEKATAADVKEIADLLNSAYRGESSKQGWTTEAHLIGGDRRTDENNVLETMTLPGSATLKCTDDQNKIVGTVNLQKQDSRLYLGMLSVSPLLQGKGIGKLLLQAAEDYAKEVGCDTVYMTVIAVRDELIAWYKRHGFADTGERKEFKEDGLTGNHLQKLEFATLEKRI